MESRPQVLHLSRGPQKRVPLARRRRAGAGHLARDIDRVGPAAAAAQGAQVLHRAVGPQKGVPVLELVGDLAPSGDLIAVVEARGLAHVTPEGAEVHDFVAG